MTRITRKHKIQNWAIFYITNDKWVIKIVYLVKVKLANATSFKSTVRMIPLLTSILDTSILELTETGT